MQMIEIVALENGARRNQTYHGYLPDGWAVIPPEMEIPDTFPFVGVVVEEIEGVMTVTGMSVGVIPEPSPEPSPMPEREPTADEILNIILGV